MRVRAIKHRDVALVNSLVVQATDFFDEETRFVIFAVQCGHHDRRPVTVSGPQILRAAALIASNDGVGCGQNVLRGSVVLFQQDRAGTGKIAFEFFDVADRGAAKRVDRLVRIPHNCQLRAVDTVIATAGEQSNQHILRVVRVLVFVDQDVTETSVVVLSDGGFVAQQGYCARNQIIKIEGISLAQSFVVFDIRFRHNLRDRIVGRIRLELGGSDQLILQVRDSCGHHFRREAFDIDVGGFEHHLYQALRILRIVNCER